MSKVTVVIPVYKTQEELLRNCISSAMNQTLTDIEIIIVDDGSPDNCGSICDEYAAKDERITVVHKINEGVSVARNIGIENAASKYICFLDGDDWIEAETLETAYAEAEKTDADVLQWSYIWHIDNKAIGDNPVFNVEGVLSKELKEEMILKAIVDFHPSYSCNKGFAAGAPWAKLYRRDFLLEKDLRFVPGLARSQDRVFNLYTYEAADRIAYLDRPFSHYIANDTSAVATYRPNVESIYQLYLQKIEEFVVSKRPDSKLFYDAYTICICYAIQQIFTQYLFNPKNTMKFGEKYAEVKRITNTEVYFSGIRNCNNIKESLTKKQYAIYALLKKKMCFLATLAMHAKSRK